MEAATTSSVHQLDVRDGLVASKTTYLDGVSFLRQLGMSS
jgi:hypothetical protein